MLYTPEDALEEVHLSWGEHVTVKEVKDVQIAINFLHVERDWNTGEDYDLLVQVVWKQPSNSHLTSLIWNLLPNLAYFLSPLSYKHLISSTVFQQIKLLSSILTTVPEKLPNGYSHPGTEQLFLVCPSFFEDVM